MIIWLDTRMWCCILSPQWCQRQNHVTLAFISVFGFLSFWIFTWLDILKDLMNSHRIKYYGRTPNFEHLSVYMWSINLWLMICVSVTLPQSPPLLPVRAQYIQSSQRIHQCLFEVFCWSSLEVSHLIKFVSLLLRCYDTHFSNIMIRLFNIKPWPNGDWLVSAKL